LLVLGGTWSFYPPEYQEEFIRDLYYAANVFFDAKSGIALRKRKSLEEEQFINETAQVSIIGLTLETRPDCIIGENKAVNRMYKKRRIENGMLDEIRRFRRYGCTRVQVRNFVSYIEKLTFLDGCSTHRRRNSS